MDISNIFEFLGKVVALVGVLFALYRWWKREEHFPRVNFDIDVEIIDRKDNKYVLNVVATLENKGEIPLKIKDFNCELRGLASDDSLELGTEKIRNQLNFKHNLNGGAFIPANWDFSFVFPSVKTTYTFVTIIPDTMIYLFVRGSFIYLANGESHHAGKIIKIANKSSQ